MDREKEVELSNVNLSRKTADGSEMFQRDPIPEIRYACSHHTLESIMETFINFFK